MLLHSLLLNAYHFRILPSGFTGLAHSFSAFWCRAHFTEHFALAFCSIRICSMALFLDFACSLAFFWSGIPLTHGSADSFMSLRVTEVCRHPFLLALLKLGITIKFRTPLALPFFVLIRVAIASRSTATYSVIISMGKRIILLDVVLFKLIQPICKFLLIFTRNSFQYLILEILRTVFFPGIFDSLAAIQNSEI